MAHQTDVHVVHQSFESENGKEKVVDPVCGMTLERKASKHVLFRENETLYFCSQACEERFLSPGFKKAG